MKLNWMAVLQPLFEGVEEQVLISAQGPRSIKLHLLSLLNIKMLTQILSSRSKPLQRILYNPIALNCCGI